MSRSSAPPLAFSGFASPNFTQVPDELFDQLMPQLTDAELRVVLYIIRRTFGFKREADAISLSQMVAGITTKEGRVLDSGTGLSKATVARGLAGLRDKGVILAERNASAERGDEPTTYRLRFKTESSEETLTKNPVSHQRDTPRVSAVRQAVSHPRDTQERGEQETDFELSNSQKTSTFDEARHGQIEIQTHPSRSKRHQTGSDGLQPISAMIQPKQPPVSGGGDRPAIAAAMARLADELGDGASAKASLTRAMNLHQSSGVSRDVFIDLLHLAKGEVRDRRTNPGKAPLPRNQMAYFFAVVEDRLGLRETSNDRGGDRE
jgi:hypothetical protein